MKFSYRKVAISLVVTVALGLSLALLTIGVAQIGLPTTTSFKSFQSKFAASDLVVVDANGQPIQEQRIVYSKRQFPWVSLGHFSSDLKTAIVLAEDRKFWSHNGWTMSGLLRAALGRGMAGGGSTITMQLVNLMFPTLRKSRPWLYKCRQILLAQRIEKYWTKEQILEAYLNLVPFRGEVVGVPAASWLWFEKYPSGILASESYILASLIPSPNADLQRLRARMHRLSGCGMHCDLLDTSLTTVLNAGNATYRANYAPHFASRLNAKGVVIHSTIDGDLQRYLIETAIAQRLALDGKNVHDIAALVVENRSGKVLAYLGNQERHSSARHLDGVRALRQAGSTLKPFLYGLAIEERLLTASSRVNDDPLDVVLPTGTYSPKNYDKQYQGAVTVRRALGNSLNIPAVNVLKLVGTSLFVDTLEKFGFSHLRQADHYGLSLALGSGQVSLEELVQAYRVLGNGGWYSKWCTTMPCQPAKKYRAMSPEAAFIVSDILSDNSARSEVFGRSSPLQQSFWAAVKTGTSRDMRDNWCIGFSSEYTVGVWVGNFNNEPMRDVSGVTGAAPLWANLMNWLHENRATKPWSQPIPPPDVQWVSDGTNNGEFFLSNALPINSSGSQPTTTAGRILYPKANALLATDPGIPVDTQKVMFRLEGGQQGRLYLDGTFHADADEGVLWSPVPGRHVLSLIGKEGKVLDRVAFSVRE